jgi:threo-3-hydroxy-L-aspartate ammonia-lyase
MQPRPTTFLEPYRLQQLLGVPLVLALESLQHTGSFKYRAAHNVVANVPQSHILAASSGNFGQAIALASKLQGKRCTVVMPETSAKVKIDAVREYGAEADLIDTKKIQREERQSQLAEELGDVYLASAYDDPLVIAGNASLGEEIAASGLGIQTVVCPVGGGGLASGLIQGLRGAAEVVAAEPAMANDAARSLREGRIVRHQVEPLTVADGARTISLGQHNWAILQHGLKAIVEVEEEEIREAVRLLFSLANVKSEPTGALSLAAVIRDRHRLQGRRVCCVVSGGNVDPGVYAEILGS